VTGSDKLYSLLRYKLNYSLNSVLQYANVFGTANHCHPSLIFASKSRSLLL
jgi:hypothetical protein